MNKRHCFLNRSIAVFGLLASAVTLLNAQNPPTGAPETNALLQNLLSEMRDLKVAVTDMRGQLEESRRDTQQLRKELDAARQQMEALRGSSGVAAPTPSIANLVEEQQLLNAKVSDQYQTKVESGSKFRVRLSGMALFNMSSTHGSVNDIDLPETAQAPTAGDSRGNFSATLRQSTIGLEVFGPDLAGAKTSGDVHFDFFGGFPASSNGVTSGLVRLRTAKIRLDWERTSLTAGQENLFFSPLNPTSFASTAYPALGSAGNLWTWTPQVYAEHRLPVSNQFTLLLQGGILDPLSGETSGEYERQPGSGERGRLPAVAVRTALQKSRSESTFQIGAAGYYAKHDHGFGRNADAWAAMLDWALPLGRRVALSGEFYRGRSITGLGGSPGGNALLALPPLDAAGGWAQLKLKATDRLEFNAAFGEGYVFRPGLNRLLADRPIDGSPENRNASGFVNAIYRFRSNLVFSTEYRRLWTSRFNLPLQRAGHITLSGGIIF